MKLKLVVPPPTWSEDLAVDVLAQRPACADMAVCGFGRLVVPRSAAALGHHHGIAPLDGEITDVLAEIGADRWRVMGYGIGPSRFPYRIAPRVYPAAIWVRYGGGCPFEQYQTLVVSVGPPTSPPQNVSVPLF